MAIGSSAIGASAIGTFDGPPFVGRAAEFDRIVRAVNAASGDPIYLIGPKGVGKTALLRRLSNQLGAASSYLSAAVGEEKLYSDIEALLDFRNSPKLVIVDDADFLRPKFRRQLSEMALSRYGAQALILVMIEEPDGRGEKIRLGPLSDADMRVASERMIRQGVPLDYVNKFLERSGVIPPL